MRCAVLALAFGSAGACASGPVPHETPRPVAHPTLEEIFLEPSIADRDPASVSVSSDGAWLLLLWDPVKPGTGEPEEPTLRLLDVRRPQDADHRGVPLARLLPPPLPPQEELEPIRPHRAVWSKTGHLLAIARGRELFLHDPSTRRTELVLHDPPVRGADGGVVRALASEIRSVAFSNDDSELRFMDAEDLYGISLSAERFPGRTRTPNDVLNHSAALDADAHRLRWNDALDVVYGRDHPPVDPSASTDTDAAADADADAGAADEPAEAAPAVPHVWRFAEERGVVLEGLDDLPGVRSDRLSPDGRWIVARTVDDTDAPRPNVIPLWLDERVALREVRSQLADDLPSPTALWAWTATSGARRAVQPLVSPRASGHTEDFGTAVDDGHARPDGDASEGAPSTPDDEGLPHSERPWVRTHGWAPQPEPDDPARYAYSIVSEDHRRRELWVFTEGDSQAVWSEEDPRWIGGPVRGVEWTPDGRHLVLGSEASDLLAEPGRCQLFAVPSDGGPARQLTAVEGEVDDFTVLLSGEVLVVASREDPRRRSIGVVAAEAVRGEIPAEVRWLPTPPGWNVDPRAGLDSGVVVFRHESLLRTAELWATDGERAWPLTDTEPDSFASREWIRPVAVSATAPDGARVHAHVYLPPGVRLDEDGDVVGTEPRATVVFVHGAGYLQNVTDSMTRYPLNAMFHSRLASMGYPVVDVDFRGSAGYGQRFRTDVQYHLGGKDLDDIHLVVDLLADAGLVDSGRVGLYGGSYGGFLTLMALFTAPERWAAGAALRSVTDWRTYHPRYTQPRLGRPSTHPEAYARSSPIDLVEGLEDPLYLFHGLEDSNVFAQDTIRLIEALIDAGLPFDAMLYPSQGHAFEDGPHWLDEYRRIETHLLEALGPPVAAPSNDE